MFLRRSTHRRLVTELQRLLEERRRERDEAHQHALRLTIRVELVEQARKKADDDAAYWRTRAEKFIDQIGVNSGTLSAPAMDPALPPLESEMSRVFAALGTSEINKTPPPAGAAPAAPVVRGVDPAAAHAAVADLLGEM